MPEAHKICPICRSANHQHATVCRVCGASLQDAKLVTSDEATESQGSSYDFQYGETDLLEGSVNRFANTMVQFLLLVILFLIGAGVIVAILLLNNQGNAPIPEPTAAENMDKQPPVLNVESTNILNMPTVTPGPPTLTPSNTPPPSATPTITSTPAPCTRIVQSGDTLISIILNCGHRTRDVIPEVLEINDLDSEELIREGQTIFVPWPTATPDPALATAESTTSEGETNDEGTNEQGANETEGLQLAKASNSVEAMVEEDVDAFLEEFDPFAEPPTATLPPGIEWYYAVSGDTMASIINLYDADMKVLNELNPEIEFLQCDFGSLYGGPECRVMISEGMPIRVPVPTSTPTSTPSPTGNETATPTPTPLINEPNLTSPSDKAFFGMDEIITLRWLPTASLSSNQVYQVYVEDMTSERGYAANTTEIYFIVPQDWRGTLQPRHEYRWYLQIVDLDAPERAIYTTQEQTFVWQGIEKSGDE